MKKRTSKHRAFWVLAALPLVLVAACDDGAENGGAGGAASTSASGGSGSPTSSSHGPTSQTSSAISAASSVSAASVSAASVSASSVSTADASASSVTAASASTTDTATTATTDAASSTDASTTATATTSASTGMPPLCVPGESRACYTGPAQTRHVGTCADGARTCAADGLSFGPCVGSVLPALEDCSTPEFESCTLNTCDTWSQRWPGAGPGDIRLGARGGRVTLALQSPGAFVLPNGVSMPATAMSVPSWGLVGLDADVAQPLWASQLTTSMRFSPWLLRDVVVALDDQGRSVVGATFEGWLTLGGTFLGTTGTLGRTDVALIQLADDGALGWHLQWGGTDFNDDGADGFDAFADLAIGPSGDLWVSSELGPQSSFTIPPTSKHYRHSRHDLDTGAELAGLQRFVPLPDPGQPVPSYQDVIAHNAVNASAALVAAGTGAGCNLPAGTPYGYVRQVGPPAICAPSVSIGTSVDIALDDLDRVYVLQNDSLSLRDAADTLLWTTQGLGTAVRLALDPSGDVWVFGTSAGILTLHHLDTSGNILETRTFGSGVASDLAIDAAGALYLAGRATGDVDFGLGAMSGASTDAFVAKIQP